MPSASWEVLVHLLGKGGKVQGCPMCSARPGNHEQKPCPKSEVIEVVMRKRWPNVGTRALTVMAKFPENTHLLAPVSSHSSPPLSIV